jgi:CubicO group peptidase (beta-lactamase class C family)
MNIAADTSDRSRAGTVLSGFERVREAFDIMLAENPGYSAQICAVWRGITVVDLAGGRDLNDDAVTGVFSATKGAAAAVIGLMVDRGLLSFDAPASRYWPEFAAAGKGAITVRQLLSHRAGLVGVQGGFDSSELLDSRLAAKKLAASAPLWEPGRFHGYHGLTFGVLAEELVRRVAGTTLQSVYEEEIRKPYDLDFYLGFPAAAEERFRPVMPPVAPPPAGSPDFHPASDGITSVAFNAVGSEFVPTAGPISPNDREMRASGFSSIGGIGSARGLAGLYAAILGGPGTPPLISGQVTDEMSREQSFGLDRVLGFTTSFAIGYMKPHSNMEFGSFLAFGHDGAGGALGFADPLWNLAFGYIPLPMQPPGGADPKAVRLSQLVRACIRSLD